MKHGQLAATLQPRQR